MKRLRDICGIAAGALAALALLWAAAPTAAAIVAGSALGIVQNGSSATPTISTTADAPAGGTIFVNTWSTGTYSSATDSAGNTYSEVGLGTFNTSFHLFFLYANNTAHDLPAPCTVTASETSTTLVVTAVVTCSGTDVLAVGQAISGGSFTGLISAPCTLVAGAATCTITGGSTVASGTATISSTIKMTVTTAFNSVMSAQYVTGIATSAPLDVTGTITTGTNTSNTTISPTVSTGTLAQASEIVFGVVGITSAFTLYSSQSPFTDLTASGASSSAAWGYDIVGATGSVAYGPKWTSARAYGANVITFKGAAGIVAPTCSLALLGVGVC